MNMSPDQASAWIVGEIGGRIERISADPLGGWDFEATGIPAYGSSLVKDHDGFDYCLLTTENDDEVGRHRETMMFTRRDPATGRTLLIEGFYSRALGDARANADATFEGRIALVEAMDLERMQAEFSKGFSDRTLGHQLDEFGYTVQGLRNVLYYGRGPVGEDLRQRLLRSMSEINRVAMDLLEMRHAA